jgi:flagellar biosynthetic protein FliP
MRRWGVVALSVLAVLFVSGAAAAAEGAAGGGAAILASGSLSERIIQIFLVTTVLSLAPGLAMMATSLPLIVIVLSILRQGAGLQQSPPNMLIMGLAIFLTWYVMEPVFADAWRSGVSPLLAGEIDEEQAFSRATAPFADFMASRVAPAAIEALSRDGPSAGRATNDAIPLSLLAPAFVLSEIQRAFEIGFVVLLPFLIIDLLVASILMAMGMMMVPPGLVSLPFKLAFFILTNGWIAISGALVRSYL